MSNLATTPTQQPAAPHPWGHLLWSVTHRSWVRYVRSAGTFHEVMDRNTLRPLPDLVHEKFLTAGPWVEV